MEADLQKNQKEAHERLNKRRQNSRSKMKPLNMDKVNQEIEMKPLSSPIPKPPLTLSPKASENISANKVVPIQDNKSLKRESMVNTMQQDDGLSLIGELGLHEDMDFMNDDDLNNDDDNTSMQVNNNDTDTYEL